MSRWISCVRPPTLPCEASRVVRVEVARGSMPYSAVTHPFPELRRNGGHAVLDRRGADHLRAPGLDEHGPLRVEQILRMDVCRSKLVGSSIVGAHS